MVLHDLLAAWVRAMLLVASVQNLFIKVESHGRTRSAFLIKSTHSARIYISISDSPVVEEKDQVDGVIIR